MAEPSGRKWAVDGCRMASLVSTKALVSLLKARLISEHVIQWEGKDSCWESHYRCTRRHAPRPITLLEVEIGNTLMVRSVTHITITVAMSVILR